MSGGEVWVTNAEIKSVEKVQLQKTNVKVMKREAPERKQNVLLK